MLIAEQIYLICVGVSQHKFNTLDFTLWRSKRLRRILCQKRRDQFYSWAICLQKSPYDGVKWGGGGAIRMHVKELFESRRRNAIRDRSNEAALVLSSGTRKFSKNAILMRQTLPRVISQATSIAINYTMNTPHYANISLKLSTWRRRWSFIL